MNPWIFAASIGVALLLLRGGGEKRVPAWMIVYRGGDVGKEHWRARYFSNRSGAQAAVDKILYLQSQGFATEGPVYGPELKEGPAKLVDSVYGEPVPEPRLVGEK